MNTFRLKIIAIITMLIDHTGAVLFPEPQYFWLRIIGRLSFPIFVFLLVEGFNHTRNVKKYLARLGIFALLSDIPFNLAFYNSFNSGSDIRIDLPAAFKSADAFKTFLIKMISHQNIFFTLFLGLLAIYLMSLIEVKFRKQIFMSNLLDAIITLVFSFVAILLRTDYDMFGILLIVAFYLFRGSKAILALSLITLSLALPDYSIELIGLFSLIPIAFYNGQKGRNIKYLFYAFYPVHLLILFLIFWIR